MAVVRNRAATLKKTDYRYLYFETGFRFQKRFPVNRKSINSPNFNVCGHLQHDGIPANFKAVGQRAFACDECEMFVDAD